MQWLTNCGRNKEENYYDQKNQSPSIYPQVWKRVRWHSWYRVASQFNSEIYVEIGKKRVNAKSIMGMMTLGLDAGEEITLSANGEDEEAAMAGIEQYLSNQ